MKDRKVFDFVSLAPLLTDYGYHKVCVQTFIEALNAHDYIQHRKILDDIGQPLAPHTEGWSLGLQPKYFDGRVTTRRTTWVFARKEEGMTPTATAMVYFINEFDPIGYIVKNMQPGVDVTIR